jgi:hypothetical protein
MCASCLLVQPTDMLIFTIDISALGVSPYCIQVAAIYCCQSNPGFSNSLLVHQDHAAGVLLLVPHHTYTGVCPFLSNRVVCSTHVVSLYPNVMCGMGPTRLLFSVICHT